MTPRASKPQNMPKKSHRGVSTGRGKAHAAPPWAAERRAMTEIAERIRLRDQAEADAKIAEALEIANAKLSETLDPAEVARLSSR